MATISARPKTNTEIQYSAGEEGCLDTPIQALQLESSKATANWLHVAVISVKFGLVGLFYAVTWKTFFFFFELMSLGSVSGGWQKQF